MHTTLLCDNGNLYTSYCANFGSNWNNGDNAGAFQLNVNNAASNTNSNLGARLMLKRHLLDARTF